MLQLPILYLICSLLTVISTAWAVQRYFPVHLEANRYQSIDGLRGYLAFFVFLHHAAYWRIYIQKGQWHAPDSLMYAGIGTISVMLFFMITGFLFFSKLSASRGKVLNWSLFFQGRFIRLMPVYALAIFIFLLLIIILSKGNVNDSVFNLCIQSFQWIAFTLYGAPYINQVNDSLLILAGVTWTLVYEWMFYCLLPLIGYLFFKVKGSILLIGISAAFSLSIFLSNYISYVYLIAFLLGLPAVYLVKIIKIQVFAQRRIVSLFILCCYGLAVYLASQNPWLSLPIVGLIFTFIALGNNIFGLLTKSFSQILGQATYALYLFHGLFLYLLFKFLIGFEKAKTLSDTAYGWIVLGTIPPLVFVCCIIFRKVELPAIQYIKHKVVKSKAATPHKIP